MLLLAAAALLIPVYAGAASDCLVCEFLADEREDREIERAYRETQQKNREESKQRLIEVYDEMKKMLREDRVRMDTEMLRAEDILKQGMSQAEQESARIRSKVGTYPGGENVLKGYRDSLDYHKKRWEIEENSYDNKLFSLERQKELDLKQHELDLRAIDLGVGPSIRSSYYLGSPVRVRSHIRGGSYVMPHYRTRPDGFPYNNWSTKGNVNPFTGRKGYKQY